MSYQSGSAALPQRQVRQKRLRAERRMLKILLVCNFLLCGVLVCLTVLMGKRLLALKFDEEKTRGELTFAEGLDVEELETEAAWVLAHETLFPAGKAKAAQGNAGLLHFLYQYGTDTWDRAIPSALTEAEAQSGTPTLFQWDDRWGFTEYGSSVLGLTGCGPTSLSMVAIGLTGNTGATPDRIARFAMENGFYLEGTGTKWSLMTDGAASFGLTGRQITPAREEIYAVLSYGQPVIVSVGPGQFTDAGHFLVLSGLSDGKVLLHDPNSAENSSRLWDLSEFDSEIRAAWAFTPAESL